MTSPIDDPHGAAVPPPYNPPNPGAQPTRRSVPMLVFGIILTVWGGLALIGRLASAAIGSAMGAPTNPAEAAGALIGAVIFIGVPLVAGIMLIVKSKRKA